jgi:hypothetical protein
VSVPVSLLNEKYLVTTFSAKKIKSRKTGAKNKAKQTQSI